MEAVKAFNAELSSLYEVKPPISKAKMTSLTRGAIKAIKFYKHVVQSVEKFILKCKPEYKVPGLYVIDSIVRQSRHQFGTDKDVFAPRFSKNMQQTFINLFKCPAEDKSKIIRVLNLWQKNQVFPPEVIQPLFDLADPNNPIYKELDIPVQQPTNGLNASSAAAVIAKGSPALQRTPTKGNQPGNDSIHGSTANLNLTDPNVLQQLQQLQRLLTKSVDNSVRSEQVHFDKKLLDFDYGDDEDDVNPSPRPQQQSANDSVSSLLTNPEVLRQLQTLQQTMTGTPQEVDADKMRKLQEMKQQEDEFDKHLAQTVPNLPFASECEFKPNNTQMISGYYMPADMNPPNPNYPVHEYEQPPPPLPKSAPQENGPEMEVITLDHEDSRSSTPTDDRYRRRRGSRSRSRDRNGRRTDRDKDKDRRRRSRSRSRSPTRRHRSRSRERDRNRVKEVKKEEKETERDRERKKRGLPVIKKDHLSVCSTTLWVGHLSKLVHQDDLSNTFGEFGDVVSIDLIPPRGCAFIVMLRRQDAARCLNKLRGHVLHGKAITLAWAAGKGVKGKDLKDYWEGDLGVSYIPYTKIKEDIDIEMLEDGGMIDEDTMPQWMKEKVEKMGKKPLMHMPNDLPPNFLMDPQNNARQIDTSQPPPMPGAGLLQPPPILPLVSPFQFNNRLLGMNVPPGMMTNMPNMPNIPIGVPPPNLPGAMMSNQILGIGSPFQGPPGMMPPRMPNLDNKMTPPSTEANLQSLSESLMNITQPFGMVPQPPGPHDDTMDIEMEDADRTMEKSISLSEQLQHMAGQYGRPNRDDDRRDRRDDRDRRHSRSRDRDRDRERDRDRDRERDRDRGRDRLNSRDRDRKDRDNNRGRDRDRREDRRDRGNRWGDRDRDRDRERDRKDVREPETRDEKRDREKSLNDRLREMAGMGGLEEPSRDRPSRKDRKASENGPRSGPSSHSSGPSSKSNEDFGKNQSNRRGDVPPRGPPEDFPPPNLEAPPVPPLLRAPPGMESLPDMMEGPPNMMEGPPSMMDGPPNMMEGPPSLLDGLPSMEGPPNMMEAPPSLMDGPPNMMSGPPNMAMEGPPEIPNDPRRGSMHRGPPAAMDGPSDMRRDGTPDMMRHGPPDMMDGPPDMMGDDMPPHMRDGPPMMRDGPLMRDGPPMMRDGPPMMRDGPPMMRDGPPMMRDGPPMMRDGPPMMRDGPPMMRDDGPPHMRDGPNMMMERPPLLMNGPPDMMDGPPDMMMDGPPDMMMDGPPDMMMDGPPDMMMDGPPDMMMDRPPDMMMDRPQRHMRGGRRNFEQRGMRGPPGQDFFPGDDFGPRGPPLMRGNPDFGSRGPPMMGSRGPRGQFFGPRGPRGSRGHRHDGPQNFNPRFDGSFFRGPGPRGPPPPLFNDGPRHRFRGPPGRFDDRRHGRKGPDFNPDFMDRGPPDFRDRGPPDFMDRGPGGPPDFMDRPPFMDDGPPPFMDDGPPPFMDDGPPPFMDDGPPPFMEDGPPQFMGDGPPPFMGDGPPPFMGDGPPPFMGDGPPPFMGDGPPPFMEDGPPPFMHDGPPPFMDDGQQDWTRDDFMDGGPQEFIERRPSQNRGERRSRWGGGSPPRQDMEGGPQDPQIGDGQQEPTYNYENRGADQEGGSTPVRDECPPPEEVPPMGSEAPADNNPATGDAPAEQPVAE